MTGPAERLRQAATAARSGHVDLPIGLDDTVADLLDVIALKAGLIPDSVIDRAAAVADVILDDQEAGEASA